MMGDLISRQAAIGTFDCTDELIVSGSANAQNVMNYINKVVGKIETLPSAQPEIVQCKDCKHWRLNYYQDVETCFEHRNVDGTEQATRPEDYCSWAERREDG